MKAGLFDNGTELTQYSPGSFRAPPVEELATRFPQLEIQELLGQGGMGAVYRARQKSLDRLVALKILPPQSAGDPAFAERFAREARAMARLHHSNIVTVFEFGETDGLFYLLMEYVDGVNLRQAIRSKQITAEQALSIVPHICDALQYAHEEGVVHRDIKPENVLLDKRGRVKIADFGLAKLLRRGAVDVSLTATRQVVGTLHYMAPEQIERPLEVDHRADIYSLGVVFYELLTGELPVGRYKLPSEKAAIDNRLDDVVLKTLEREPSARYQNASDLKTDVQTISNSPQKIASPQFVSPPVTNHKPSPAVAPELQHLDEATVQAPGIALVVVGCLALGSQFLSVLLMSFGVGGRFVAAASSLGIIIGPVMIIGGFHLMRRSSHGLVMAGAIAGILPFSPIWVLSAPVGIWALATLRRPSRSPSAKKDAAIAPRKITDEDIDEGRALARAPGIGLILVGMIDLLVVFVLLGVLTLRLGIHTPLPAVTSDHFGMVQAGVMVQAEAPIVSRAPAWALIIPTALGVVLQVPIGLLILLGGISMVRLRTRTLSFLASFAAMVPLHVACILGFPIGIWALATLMRDDVHQAFTARRQRRTSTPAKGDYPSDTDLYGAPKPASATKVGLSVLAIIFLVLLVLFLLAAAAIGVYWIMPYDSPAA
jgi:predicted Ser/Thr protein kinase